MVHSDLACRIRCLFFSISCLAGLTLHGCGGSTPDPVPTPSRIPAPAVGRGFGDGNLVKNEDFQLLSGLSWWYSWNLNPAVDFNFSQEFVAMVWGDKDLAKLSGWSPHASTKHVLGFNEPNMRSQSNMSGEVACERWPQVVAAAKKHNLLLGSPAANYCSKPGPECYQTPLDWFADFFSQTGCSIDTVDFIATHKYGCNASNTIDFVKQLHARYNKLVWLTEFSCNDAPPSKHLNFMKEVLPVFDKMHGIIQRYAWFAARVGMPYAVKQKGELIDGDSLTALGRFYNSTVSSALPHLFV